MATALADIVPRVLVQALGCPEPFAQQALTDSAIEFCRESLVVRGDLAEITVTADDATYTLTPADAALRVVKVMRVELDGVQLEPIAPDDLPDGWSDDTGQARYYLLTNETDMMLYPAPDVGGTLLVTTAFAPTRTATTIPDDLADRWLDGIVAGALSRVLLTANQPYSDPSRAQFFKSQFAIEKANAAVAGVRGNTRVPLRVRMVNF